MTTDPLRPDTQGCSAVFLCRCCGREIYPRASYKLTAHGVVCARCGRRSRYRTLAWLHAAEVAR